MSVLAENCDLDVVCEGAKAIGIGCFSTESTIALKECRGKVSVRTSQGAAVTAADGRLIIEGDKLECLYNA